MIPKGEESWKLYKKHFYTFLVSNCKVKIIKNCTNYIIKDTVQTINFILDNTGGKVKSEAGIVIYKKKH